MRIKEKELGDDLYVLKFRISSLDRKFEYTMMVYPYLLLIFWNLLSLVTMILIEEKNSETIELVD